MPTVDWQPPSPTAQCLDDLLKRHRVLTQMYITLSNSANTLRNRMQQRSAAALNTSKAASSKLTLLLKKSLLPIISLGRRKAYCVLFPVSLLRQQPRFVLTLILILFKMPSNCVLTLLLPQCETNLVAAKRKAISLRSGLHACALLSLWQPSQLESTIRYFVISPIAYNTDTLI